MAAQMHNKLLFLLRPAQAQGESSPAALRLLASNQADSDTLQLHIIKRRGPPREQPLLLPARPARLAALLAQAGTAWQGVEHALGRIASAA
jgi:protein ImuA